MKQRIEICQNELWWCGVVDDAHCMPIGADSDYSYDLRKNASYNQCNPLLISSSGRYVYGDEYFAIRAQNGVIELESDGELDFREGMADLRRAYLDASARHFPFQGAPPKRLHFDRPQYCTWIALMYEQSQQGILRFCRELIEAGFPAGELIIDAGWQRDYGDWDFHEGRFPDPAAMFREIRELGFSTAAWIVPFVSPDSAVFRELEAKGYLIGAPGGGAFITHWWDGYSAIVDMTNPGAEAWLSGKLAGLMQRYGLAGFKFDAGDSRLYRSDNVTFRSVTPNEHSMLYGAYAERYPVNEVRACCKCAGRPIVQRIADRRHLWDAENGIRGLIPKAILQGLMGYPYLCPDMIGGGMFTDFLEESARKVDEELIIRYAQASALMPMMQFSYPVWSGGDRLRDLCRDSAELHVRYGEEIWALAQQAAATGEPILRAMNYQYPQLGWIEDQFMLGDRLLVAPVVQKGVRNRSVVLPQGRWAFLPDGKLFTVDQPFEVVEVEAPLEVLPYFENASRE